MLSSETEEKIIQSAEKLFYKKGKAGCSMQDIADDAGINRTLLNYYFRSKDQLFDAVFRTALERFVPNLAQMLNSDMSFEDYAPKLIEMVIDTMLRYPQIPIFVLQELSSNPERMPQLIREMGIRPEPALSKIKEERGNKAGPDPRQMILNLLSLCIFPFAARPVVTGVLYEDDQEAFQKAMMERKKILPEMFLRMMKNQH